MQHFSDRLDAAIRAKGNPICVGLDPRFDSIPKFITEAAIQSKGDTSLARALAFLQFNQAIIDAVSDIVPICKPQIAFYEELGTDGICAYESTCAYAREKGLLVISDAKRGDIGATAEAYAQAHLGGPTSPFNADALTVNPYMGRDTLEPFLKTAAANGGGVFVLVKTSNPGSGDLQDLKLQDGRFVREHVAQMVHEIGRPHLSTCGLSDVGAVVGATYPDEARALRALMPDTYFLIPGYGAQGGSAQDAAAGFRSDGRGAIVNNSRGIIFAYKQAAYSQHGERGFASAARAAALKMASELSGVLNTK
ncbi:MAG: orotidine-5'-phosphate decarboxylase [Planctomycetota bacterium]